MSDIDDIFKRLNEKITDLRRRSKSVPIEWPPKDRVAKRWESSGLDCCVCRGAFALCGYVRVPVGHPFHGGHYDDVQDHVSVHGGLTFSQLSGDGTWFGFDCGHCGDYMQFDAPKGATEAKDDAGSPLFPIIHPGRIWTVEDVAKEVEHLAGQLAEVGGMA